MTREQLLIWAAGFFDGEGCVSIARPIDKRSGKNYVHYQMAAIVVQRDRRALDVFVRLFGGHLNKTFRRNYQGVYWQYKLCGRNARPMLDQLLPYLVIKSEAAAAAIAFQSYLESTQQRVGVARDPDTLSILDAFYEENKILNTRNSRTDYTRKESLPSIH